MIHHDICVQKTDYKALETVPYERTEHQNNHFATDRVHASRE